MQLSLAVALTQMTIETNFAKALHEAGNIYVIYGFLDGLNLSYTTLKYCFDVICTNTKQSSSDAMHEWTLTPEGIAVAATQSIGLIVFSMMGNYFKDDDKNVLKRFIAILWPYLRDILKSLRNAYKGVRSTVQVTSLLNGHSQNFLNPFILPLGLAVSGLSILNSIFFRQVINQRKLYMKKNAKLLENIEQDPDLTPEKILAIRKSIQKQRSKMAIVRRLAFLSAIYGGLIDSLFTYIGLLSFCPLSWPVLLAMTVFCSLYSAASILTRIYEEYDYQRDLEISQVKIELALFIKENTSSIQVDFARLQEISKQLAHHQKNKALLEEQHIISERLLKKIEAFKTIRAHLKSLMTLSHLSAFFEGMRHGLAAYAAASSIIFAISTLMVSTGAAFPPILLFICIGSGVVFFTCFVIYSIYVHYQHNQQEAIVEDKSTEQLNQLLKDLKQIQSLSMNGEAHALLERDFKAEAKNAMDDGNKMTESPEFTFQQWFETIRSFFSGLGKGSKSADYALNPLQQLEKDGHYHDTPIMTGISIVSAGLFALVLSLRAYARGFGRDVVSQSGDSSLDKKPKMIERKPQVKKDEKIFQLGTSRFSLFGKTDSSLETLSSIKLRV